METLSAVDDLRARTGAWRAAGETVAFVPTMGNLHAGHLKLVQQARRHRGRVVVSVFVNPTQFAPGEDYDTYPRTLEQDKQQLQAEQVDLLFAPAVSDIYPDGPGVDPALPLPAAASGLESDSRPGFFAGVVTVVKRLFELVQPDIAVFGEKDYQQLAVVRGMVQQLGWPIRIEGVPTVRETDGLAMSSRNQYLDAGQRRLAPELYRSLCEVALRARAGQTPYRELEAAAMQRLAGAGFVPEYVAIRHADSLQPVERGELNARVLAAARLGSTRLIDNIGL